VKQFLAIYAGTLLGVLLIFLGVTGRLNPVFALLGAVLPLALRFTPLLMRSVQAFGLFRHLKSMMSSRSTAAQSPQQSEIRTSFIHMVLQHDTGYMSGEVLQGSMVGERLSNMDLKKLMMFLDECRADPDSLNLMHAYLDRQHAGWREQTTADNPSNAAGDQLSERQAYEVLGLEEGASRAEIVAAHRKLMQKNHPDHGGSTYLAARINEAKDLLTKK